MDPGLGWTTRGPWDGWALSMDGPHEPTGWMCPGQGWALDMIDPGRGWAPMGPGDGWALGRDGPSA